MKQGFGAAAIVLIVLVVIRTIAQFAIAISSVGTTYEYTYGIMGVAYIVALVGLFMKKKWGAILILVIAILDVLSAVSSGGASALGAAVFDLLIIWLAYTTYKADVARMGSSASPAPEQK